MSQDNLQALALFGSALAGRTVGVRPVQAGTPPWTDGTVVYLDESAGPTELLQTLSVQACLLSAGSLTPEVLRRLNRREGLARRYLALEGHRALASQEALLPAVVRDLLDRHIAARCSSPEHALHVAGGRNPIAPPPRAFGVIRSREALAASGTHAGPAPASNLPDVGNEEDDPTEAMPDPFSSPVGGGGAIGKLLQRLLTGVRGTSEGGQPGSDTLTGRGRRARPGAGLFSSTAADATSEDSPRGVSTGWTYPEWDDNRHEYRAAWCTVSDEEPAAREGEPLPSPDVHALRRPLTRLGGGLDTWHRQAHGDDIDIDSAVECLVDIRAGAAGDFDVYLESRRSRRDLSAHILLDVSGSSAEPGSGGRTVHQHQMAAAHALAVALHELGDRVALSAFRSHGRGSVQVIPVLRFGEPVGTEMGRRLAALSPGAYSRLGAAIRHGATVLSDHGGTARRLLVVISDGLAYDHGYERAYGCADARRALAETRRHGTGCLALTIGADTRADDLGKVFGSAAHASIPRAEDLADVIGPLLRSALHTADLRRRVTRLGHSTS